ncbi:MOZ/SAS family protein [Sarocladium implicatum]|nr:MOZ/SAS family protein [Sarocladium implicatum]
MSNETLRAPNLTPPNIAYQGPHHTTAQPPRQSPLARPNLSNTQQPPSSRTPTSNTRDTSAAARVMKASPQKPSPATPRPDRNIDKVVFGSLCFRTWYPSYYGKEVLGDTSGNVSKGVKETTSASVNETASKSHPTKKIDHHPQGPHMLERLYVCPSCFKYSKELVAWWGHVRICEQQGHVPGTKIYMHPRGRRKVLVPADGSRATATPVAGSAKKRRGDGGVKYVEETVEDEGEWSIWEVDGEKDGLFCQNLSLFAKLFLDNKSVFFDVTGFNYFLLVYTPPPAPAATSIPTSPSQPAASSPPLPTASVSATARPPSPQITGFFSKEKMSWDNNNLACILVFPPWQRKGLGALLMGASYEISRREGVMGGPEKPISDLGRKGYRRYWVGEIARWLFGLDASSDGEEVIVDINDCSQATWIAVEDCLATLRDMEVVEDIGLGPGKPSPITEDDEDQEMEKHPKTKNGDTEHGEPEEEKLVSRVRVDKEAVRRYLATNGISLERMCDSEGFVEGYAVKTTPVDDEDEDVDME